MDDGDSSDTDPNNVNNRNEILTGAVCSLWRIGVGLIFVLKNGS